MRPEPSPAAAPGEPGAVPDASRVRRAARAGAWLSAGYAAAIFWASSRPNPFPFLPRSWFDSDKLLHAGGFTVLGALLRLALAAVRPPRRALALAVLLGAAYGATDEVHQAFVPGRSPDVRDWVADVAGVLAGAALASALLRRRVGAGSIRP